MKKIRAAAFFCTVLFAIGLLAMQYPNAQSSQGQMGAQPQATPGQQPPVTPPSQQTQSSQAQSNIDEQVRIISDELGLTKDQQTKLRSILVDQHEQAMTLVKDNTISREDKIAKIHSLRETTVARVRDILTVDQKPKFDAMLQQQDERMRQRQQQQSPSGAPPPTGVTPPPSSGTPSTGTPPSSNPPGDMRRPPPQ